MVALSKTPASGVVPEAEVEEFGQDGWLDPSTVDFSTLPGNSEPQDDPLPKPSLEELMAVAVAPLERFDLKAFSDELWLFDEEP